MLSTIRNTLSAAILAALFVCTSHSAAAQTYEISLPILIDADVNPYNRVAQTGQTLLWLNEISWDAYYSTYQGTDGSIHIPGISTDGFIQDAVQFDYMCAWEKKNDSVMQDTVYIPNIRHVQSDRIFGWKKFLKHGFIEDIQASLSINKFKFSARSEAGQSLYCAVNKDRYQKDLHIEIPSELTYRIQYPVGTHILIPKQGVTPEKKVRIASNYNSHNESGSGILLASNELDRCIQNQDCTTESVTITSLSGTKTEISKSRKEWYVNHPSVNEYFAVPADTAKITFKFIKK